MRTLLFLLIAFVVVTAMPSGLLLMYHSNGNIMGLQPSMLEATPFSNFFIPGLILFAVVGGSNLIALLLLMDRSRKSYRFTFAAGVILLSWIVIQMFMLQSYHWLHGMYLGIGFSVSLLSYQLMGKAAF